MHDAQSRSLHPALAAVALAGAVAALGGGYWDDAWHTERGRDTFFIAPHLAIYGGITLIGGVLALWVALAVRQAGARSSLRRPTLVLAAISVAVTLASGPIDNVWHEAFGRDSVIWSPPHMLGIVGTLGLGAALLAEVAHRRALALVAGGLVLAAATFTVVEFDTDVPQFDAAFYLPVLATSAAIALALVRMVVPGRWSATEAAAAHLAFVLVVSGFLLVVGFEAPALPLLVAPAVLLDVGEARHWSPAARAAAFTVALFAVYVPARNRLGEGVEISTLDVLVGLPLAVGAVLVVLSLATPRPASSARSVSVATTGLMTIAAAVVILAAAPRAMAHDPGQGRDAGSVDLAVIGGPERTELRGRWNSSRCAEISGAAVVARRGGVVVRGPLAVAGCRLQGAVALPTRGRWFVYVELQTARGSVESWLPIRAGAGERASAVARYAYAPAQRSGSAVKRVVGGVLYAVMVALLAATFLLLSPTRASAERRRRESAAAAASS